MKTSLLPSWIVTGTGSGQRKPEDKVMMVAEVLLLMTMEIAMLQVFLKVVLLSELLH